MAKQTPAQAGAIMLDDIETRAAKVAELCRRRPGLDPLHARLAERSRLFGLMTQGRGKQSTYGTGKPL